MKQAWIAIAPILLFASVTAHAQEDAEVGDAEGAATEPEPGTNNVPKLDTGEEPERGWRAGVRRQREIDALHAAMAIEGCLGWALEIPVGHPFVSGASWKDPESL